MKRSIFRIFLFLLAVALFCSCFAGCKSGKEEETTESHDTMATVEDKYEADNLPDDLDFGGQEIKVLTWEETKADDWSDDLNGEVINDATFKSRAFVSERLNITFNISAQKGSWDYRTQFASNLESYMLSGLSFDLVGQYTPTAALTATRGLLTDLSDLDYINFDNPWWPSSLMDVIGIGDSMYFASGDASVNVLHMMYCTMYNKDLIEQYKKLDADLAG